MTHALTIIDQFQTSVMKLNSFQIGPKHNRILVYLQQNLPIYAMETCIQDVLPQVKYLELERKYIESYLTMCKIIRPLDIVKGLDFIWQRTVVFLWLHCIMEIVSLIWGNDITIPV